MFLASTLSSFASVAFAFHPPGYVPRYEVVDVTVGLLSLDDELDIPAHGVKRHTAQFQDEVGVFLGLVQGPVGAQLIHLSSSCMNSAFASMSLACAAPLPKVASIGGESS